MIRIDEDKIMLTQEELHSIAYFIDSALEREWDRHTDTFICEDPIETGKRRMNTEMYDMMQEMYKL